MFQWHWYVMFAYNLPKTYRHSTLITYIYLYTTHMLPVNHKCQWMKYNIWAKKRMILLSYIFPLFCRSITSLASSTASSDKKPSRPKSFSIHRLFKKQPKEHQSNCNCDECSTKILSKTVSEVPKIKCSFVSAPATPINHHIAR